MTKPNTRYRNFCITINNYTEEWIDKIAASEDYSYGILGREIGDNGTPHLQGYLELKKQTRFTSVVNALASLCDGKKPHIEPRRGTAREAADYCKKDGDYKEWGEMANPGRRTDLEHIKKMIENGKSELDVAQAHFGTWAKNPHVYKKYRELLMAKKGDDYFATRWKDYKIRGWQIIAWSELLFQTDREILWVVDKVGCMGKTEFANWLVAAHGAIILEGGKKKDMAYVYDYEPYVVFDIVRQGREFVSYATIESIKNGRIFSGKYHSKLKKFPPPKVLVLANFEPDYNALSEDRWSVMDLCDYPRDKKFPQNKHRKIGGKRKDPPVDPNTNNLPCASRRRVMRDIDND